MALSAEQLHLSEQLQRPHLELVVDNTRPDFSEASDAITAEATIDHELRRPASDLYKGRIAVEAMEAEYDAITELSEMVDGQMRTEFELTFDGDDLYGEDGRSITETAVKGLKAAEKAAEENPNLQFEVERRQLELDGVLSAVEMVKTGKVNTQVELSDYPEALQDSTEDVGGYNSTRKQTMARATIVRPNGSIKMISQTLDQSNRQALEAVDADLGFETEAGELLRQRRQLNLPADKQNNLMDRVVDVYDTNMTEQFDGEWFAGRQPIDYRNTYDFVCQQTDLIEAYKELQLSDNLTDSMRYNLAATINDRFVADQAMSSYSKGADLHDYAVHVAGNVEQLAWEIYNAGQTARAEGKVFNACGGTYKAEGKDDSTEAQMEAAGYLNESMSKTWHGGKIYKNAKCVSCEEVKSEVGACKICKNCVDHPKGKVRTTQSRTPDPKKAKINKKPAKVISIDTARKAI